MTILARYAASVPIGVLEIACLELSHPDWATPLRRVMQPDDWTVTVDDGSALFLGWQTAGAWRSERPSSDDSGRASRTLTLDDVDNAVHTLIEAVRDSADRVACTIRLYHSTDLTTPVIIERYDVESSAPGPGSLSLAVRSQDIGNWADPFIKHTLVNTPGLRGR